jgi:predicted transcriptional regulator of viral defense system
MDFNQLLAIVGDEPVFESALLLAGEASPEALRLQLTRWTKARRLYQLRRGLYTLAPPYQKVKPHPFLIANRMMRASYVSCQSALAFYDLIPEYVPVTVSVTTGRPARWETPLGVFEFHHIKKELLRGYRLTGLGDGQQAFTAAAEKALLDLLYLQPGSDTPAYLAELRLQNLERLDLDEFRRQGEAFRSLKVHREVQLVEGLALAESEEYATL